MAFVHLHNHTEHSLCEGVMSVGEMARRAAELGMPAIAVTDRGTMAGAVELRDACVAVEAESGQRMKPIYGCCVHLDPGVGLERAGNDEQCQITLLAKMNAGYENLLRLVTESNESAVSSRCKPHVTLGMLSRYGESLIGLSGGASGVVAMAVIAGKNDEAREWALKLASCFGRGDFYIELQNQGLFLEGGMTQAELNRELSRLALECGLATVATNDAHYLRSEDAELHLLMRCVKRSTRLSRKVRDRFPSDQFFLKDEREMREALAAFPEACDSTVEIAGKCNVVLRDDLALPELPVPEGETAESLFRRLYSPCEGKSLRFEMKTETEDEANRIWLREMLRLGEDPGKWYASDDFSAITVSLRRIAEGAESEAAGNAADCGELEAADIAEFEVYDRLYGKLKHTARVGRMATTSSSSTP